MSATKYRIGLEIKKMDQLPTRYFTNNVGLGFDAENAKKGNDSKYKDCWMITVSNHPYYGGGMSTKCKSTSVHIFGYDCPLDI